MQIFDYIKLLTNNKTKLTDIESLPEHELKDCSPFMINRFLGTHPDLIPFSHYSDRLVLATGMDKRRYLKFMFYFLPKGFFKLNFPKADKNKINEEYLLLIKNHYIFNAQIAITYYNILQQNNQLKTFVENFGIEFKK